MTSYEDDDSFVRMPVMWTFDTEGNQNNNAFIRIKDDVSLEQRVLVAENRLKRYRFECKVLTKASVDAPDPATNVPHKY